MLQESIGSPVLWLGFVALVLAMPALDSVPAVFAVTNDPFIVFIVFTANVFAILGLRSPHVLRVGVVEELRHLKVGLSLVLAFVGIKMLLLDPVNIPIALSMGLMVAILAASIVTWLTAQFAAEPRRPEVVHG